jgi:Na+(H+)/acetate symporter ActP
MQKYAKNHGIMHYFLHKYRDLVGRGGFEPLRTKRKALQIKTFSVRSPIVHQTKIYFVVIEYCLLLGEFTLPFLYQKFFAMPHARMRA